MAKKKIIRKEELIKTGEEVFSERGYFLTKVSDIVERAGVSQGTFYLNFESKKALFIEIIRAFHKGIKGVIDSTNLKGMTTAEKIKLLQCRIFDFIVENEKTASLIYREGYVEKEFISLINLIHGDLIGMKKQVLKEHFCEEEAEVYSYMLSGLTRGFFLYVCEKRLSKELYKPRLEHFLSNFLSCLNVL